MSEKSDPVKSVLDGQAWTDFCRSLERAGSVILENSANDPLERAEGRVNGTDRRERRS